MSTILDALKRVQRDREQARPLDLRESLTAVAAPIPLRRPTRRRSRLPLLLGVFAIAAAFVGYQAVLPLFSEREGDLLELALAAPPPEPGLGVSPPTTSDAAPSGLVEPQPPAPVAPAPEVVAELQPEAQSSFPIAQAAPPRQPRVAARTGSADAALGAVAGDPPASQPDQPRMVPPPATFAQPIGRPAVRTFPALKRRAPPRSDDVARAPAATRPKPTRAPDVAAPPGLADSPVQRAPVDFPTLRVANVIWHPDPARRRAEVTVDETPLEDAREGDIVKGIEVEEITPGAVQFKLGGALKTVRIGP